MKGRWRGTMFTSSSWFGDTMYMLFLPRSHYHIITFPPTFYICFTCLSFVVFLNLECVWILSIFVSINHCGCSNLLCHQQHINNTLLLREFYMTWGVYCGVEGFLDWAVLCWQALYTHHFDKVSLKHWKQNMSSKFSFGTGCSSLTFYRLEW